MALNLNETHASSRLDVTESQTKAEEGRSSHYKKRGWKRQRSNSTKIRVRLPPIESYQKELEFQADAPGRVVVRLERLMGTDKIKITDAKYMSTLLERLEKEENETWIKRTKERKQAEKNRFRQLAVEGLMEPTPDMSDLYNHPVFRVNRILNRLTKLDMDVSVNPNKKLPPITLVEPFSDGQTRYNFGPEYDGTCEPCRPGEDFDEEGTEDEIEREENRKELKSLALADSKPGKMEDQDEEEEDVEWGGEDYIHHSDKLDSLSEAKMRYGIPNNTNIENKCRPFRSKLVELVYDDEVAVAEVNNQTAQFRDLLIHIGQKNDGPEMREKIRRMRRLCIDSCRHAVHLLLQQVRSDISEGIPVDFSPQLVLLFFCTQLLLRELRKCRRLVITVPVDMTTYYENKPGTSSLGGVLSQIILCRQLNPDFNQEEICSIDKDTVEITNLLDEMQEFMPKENTQTLALAGDEVFTKWARRRRKKSMYCNFGSLCCVSKSGRFTV